MIRLTLYLSVIFIVLAFSGACFGENQPNQGFIHGTVVFQGGEEHTGYLRWESEEAFWDDLFHCGYRENPWLEFIDLKALNKEKRDQYYATHGLIQRLAYALEGNDDDGPGWRMFLSRFGDIQSFEIHAGKDDFVVTADGARHRIGGYANDNGSDLWLYEKDQEPLEIEWNDLVSIIFSAAPADHPAYAKRLFGTVETTRGNFTGPIMWDKSECLSIDKLDGENDDGDLTIAMGDIRRIKKVDSRSVIIEEKNGLQYPMRGSNDVDSGNRGIWIHTEDRGWVDIPWKLFTQVTFSEQDGSGSARSSFNNSQALQGVVHLVDGTTQQGRLVYDLDEGFAWDIFNGNDRGIGFDIPFTMISKVQRLTDETCKVELASGQSLELSENQDTGRDHGGVLVFMKSSTDTAVQTDAKAEYIPWRLVDSITFF